MALVDPYSACPCGSDKKFKWCCQKVEAYADRGHRLEDNGQHEAALAAYNEGLAKVPRNPWLLLQKSVLLIELQKLDEAKECVATVLQSQPDNLGAAMLLCRLVLGTEGPAPAVAELQRALLHAKHERRKHLFKITAILASELARANHLPAALKHFELAIRLDSSAESMIQASLESLKSNAAVAPWLKDSYALEDVSGGLNGPFRAQFEQALDWRATDFGTRPPRPSSCSPPTASPATRPITTWGFVGSGWATIRQLSRRCGAGSLARARQPGLSIWKSFAS